MFALGLLCLIGDAPTRSQLQLVFARFDLCGQIAASPRAARRDEAGDLIVTLARRAATAQGSGRSHAGLASTADMQPLRPRRRGHHPHRGVLGRRVGGRVAVERRGELAVQNRRSGRFAHRTRSSTASCCASRVCPACADSSARRARSSSSCSFSAWSSASVNALRTPGGSGIEAAAGATVNGRRSGDVAVAVHVGDPARRQAVSVIRVLPSVVGWLARSSSAAGVV